MNATADQAALVLFSGGQDSTTCLAWALLRFSHVETVGFAYGQRHAVELECRPRIRERLIKAMPQVAKRLGPDHVLDLGFIADIGGTALTEETAITMAENGLPTTFVPGRNLLFFTAAAALAYRRNLSHLVGGMCETDYSGYPDCREATLKALETAINLGMATSLVIDTPLMRIDKAETFAMARELGGDPFLQLIIEDTHSCYRGDRTHRHDWGYGCSECPACGLRSNGYEKFRAEAPHDL